MAWDSHLFPYLISHPKQARSHAEAQGRREEMPILDLLCVSAPLRELLSLRPLGTKPLGTGTYFCIDKSVAVPGNLDVAELVDVRPAHPVHLLHLNRKSVAGERRCRSGGSNRLHIGFSWRQGCNRAHGGEFGGSQFTLQNCVKLILPCLMGQRVKRRADNHS